MGEEEAGEVIDEVPVVQWDPMEWVWDVMVWDAMAWVQMAQWVVRWVGEEWAEVPVWEAPPAGAQVVLSRVDKVVLVGIKPWVGCL